MYTILLADDRAVFMRQLRRFSCLREQPDFQVAYECQNGVEALETLRRERVDLVITDIRMPMMNGIELLKAIRQEKLCSCVVLLSEYADFAYAKQGLVLGAFDYCLKPFDNDKMVKLLRRAKEFLDCLEQENYYQTDAKLLLQTMLKQDALYLETARQIYGKITRREKDPDAAGALLDGVLTFLRDAVLQERPWLPRYTDLGRFTLHTCPSEPVFLQMIHLFYEEINELVCKNCGQLIDNVCETILEHVESDVSLQSLAQEHFVNKTYLSHIFKSKTGLPLNTYLTNVKMKRARMLLAQTEEKISSIAGILGFEDTTYFSRLFKLYFSMTPSEFRRHEDEKTNLQSAK